MGRAGRSPDYRQHAVSGRACNLEVADPAHRLMLHGGQIPGCNGVIHRYIDDQVIVIVLSNEYWSRADAIAREFVPKMRAP